MLSMQATNSNPVQCGQASVEWETSSDQLLSAYVSSAFHSEGLDVSPVLTSVSGSPSVY